MRQRSVGRSGATISFIAPALALAFLLCSCADQSEPDRFEILTPPAPAGPRINGPKIVGTRPGAPFIFRIAATGERPMEFTALDLPEGLVVDASTGQIRGALLVPGRHKVELRASNAHGAAERELTIVVGEEIALTPPMGWNSWNCWGGRVDQDKVQRAARALVANGLREHGWSYINIDDGWQGVRGGAFNAIQPNRKFPDIVALSDEIHTLGLKLGIYSTPWRTSFHGHIGSSADTEAGSYDWIAAGTHNADFKFTFPKERSRLAQYRWLRPLSDWLKERREDKIKKRLRTFGAVSFANADARQWFEWGVDYLKYDWVPVDVAHAAEMRRELDGIGRDIVYSVANNTPFAAADDISRLANAWRTSTDVKDEWRHIGNVGFAQDRWAAFTRPGHYVDPDMLVVGQVGWGKPRPTRLTSHEQYTQISLWCLLSAPLLLGCDLEKLDPFTLGLLTNDEVLAVNQDPLCKQATRVDKRGDALVYAKVLEDGSRAVGLFNTGDGSRTVVVTWQQLGVDGPQAVRDLWRQSDLGVFAERFETPVARHGVVLLRVAPPASSSLASTFNRR